MATDVSESKTLEFRVGLFILIGLLIIGGMVIQFGRVGDKIRKSYLLIVELPNASGLLKNSKVLLSGAPVGTVTSSPRVLDHARGVAVDLTIYEEVRIPRNAQIVVGSSGLLGDRFVDVITKAEDVGGYYEPGETVHGVRQSGMDDITREGGFLVGDLRAAVANLNQTITRIDKELLKEQTFKDLQGSLANLNATTKNFLDSSAKLTLVLEDARSAVADARGVIGGAKDAMSGAKETISTAQAAATDVRGAIGDARKVLGSVKSVADKATRGDGALPTLLSDKALSDNLKALIANLRRSGVLFYRDRAAASKPESDGDAAEPAASPSPPPRRSSNRR
jgi:phospholipid/cholesterol/gamma-HCH transport system substrate-binding protein